MENNKPIVTITGISGYIGAQTCLYFLKHGGFRVRGTVRSLQNEKKIEPLKRAFGEYFDQLEMVEADLLDEQSIINAIEQSTYIVHTASPVMTDIPKDENLLIRPAVNGTVAVMKAAHINKVKRVVITSSVAAIYITADKSKKFFNENDWTDTKIATAYERSKTFAEKAAWEFIDNLPEDEKFDLVTINPGMVLGPNLNEAQFAVGDVVKKIMMNQLPGLPHVQFPMVDVRNVADAHLQAILVPEAAGKRFILVHEGYWFMDMSQWLQEKFPNNEYKIVKKKLPKSLVWFGSLFNTQARLVYIYWGLENTFDNTLSKNILKIEYLPIKEAVQEMADTLIDTGYIPDKRKK